MKFNSNIYSFLLFFNEFNSNINSIFIFQQNSIQKLIQFSVFRQNSIQNFIQNVEIGCIQFNIKYSFNKKTWVSNRAKPLRADENFKCSDGKDGDGNEASFKH